MEEEAGAGHDQSNSSGSHLCEGGAEVAIVTVVADHTATIGMAEAGVTLGTQLHCSTSGKHQTYSDTRALSDQIGLPNKIQPKTKGLSM